MNEYMRKQWNRKVRPKDEVVILGDFAISKGKETNELLKSLNGKKFLIVGNHDKMFLSDKEFDRSAFEWIKDYARLSDNKRGIVLSHYPMLCYDGQYRRDENGVPKRYMLYGHVHNTADEMRINDFINITRNSIHFKKDGTEETVPCNMINCFCMFSDYVPLTLDEWIVVDRERRQQLNKSNTSSDLDSKSKKEDLI